MITNTLSTIRTPRILLIEENPLLRQMIQIMIQILGARCTAVQQPSEALELFQQGYDLVLLDLGLSQTSSFELAQQMRSTELSSGRHTPIIANATVADPEVVEPLCFSAGIDDLCSKISSIQDVYEILTQWLAHPLVMPIHLLDIHIPVAA